MNTRHGSRTVLRKVDYFTSEQTLAEAEERASAARARWFAGLGAAAGAVLAWLALRGWAATVTASLAALAAAVLLGYLGARLADSIVYIALFIGVLCPIVFGLATTLSSVQFFQLRQRVDSAHGTRETDGRHAAAVFRIEPGTVPQQQFDHGSAVEHGSHH